MSRNNTKKGKLRCVRCGSTEVAKYLYGMPAFNEKLEKELEKGKVVLGGCVVNWAWTGSRNISLDPKYYCRKCKKDFWIEPFVQMKDSMELRPEYVWEDMRNTTKEVRLEIQGYLYGGGDFYADKTKEGAFVRVNSHMRPIRGEFPDPELEQGILITKKDWKSLMKGLYDKARVHEWKSRYKAIAEDAIQWKLEIWYEDGSKKCLSGSGAFPPYWDEFKEALLPYIKL